MFFRLVKLSMVVQAITFIRSVSQEMLAVRPYKKDPDQSERAMFPYFKLPVRLLMFKAIKSFEDHVPAPGHFSDL